MLGKPLEGLKKRNSTQEDVLARLSSEGIVPVIRMQSVDLAERAVEALAEAGITTMEITLTVPGAVNLIQRLADEGQYLVGAGTVLNLEAAQASIEAGARFIVSPCIIKGLAELCHRSRVLCIMNGLTPQEVHTAWNNGSDAVKVFPAQSVGGPKHIKALKAVFPEIPLVPTGGVNLQNIGDYLEAGAAFVGAGSELVGEQVVLDRGFHAVTSLARKYLDIARERKIGG